MSQQTEHECHQQRNDQNDAVDGTFLLLADFASVNKQQIENPNNHRDPRQDDGYIQDK